MIHTVGGSPIKFHHLFYLFFHRDRFGGTINPNRLRLAITHHTYGPPMLHRRLALASMIWLLAAVTTHSADWPTHRKDFARSGVTAEVLNPEHLREAWVWRSAHAPTQAWPGPARWDAYGKIPDLRSMRNFDPVFHISAVGASVFFGSSADDTLYCLDAKTGKLRWTFTTQGPIRIAPTIQDGKVYFGSDDGFAYCLRADTGTLEWKITPSDDRSLVLHHGRLISFWPIRTGIVVADGTAYFAASMFPWKQTFLCAVDANTGKAKGDGRFVKEFARQTLEAPMLASAKHLIIPQGRISPLVFERSNGKQLGFLQSGGGSFLLLSDDGQVFQGPGNRKGDLIANVPESKGKPVSFHRANSAVVQGKTAYLLDDHAVAAADRGTRADRWRTVVPHAGELLLAGELLYVGSRDEVCALESATGKKVWRHDVHGRAFGLAVANQRLFVSTDEGCIHCFEADPKHRNKLEPLAAAKLPRTASFDKIEPLTLKDGPTVRYLGVDRAELRWTSHLPTPSIVEFGETEITTIRHKQPTTEHRVELKNLRRERIYRYRILETEGNTERATDAFELDTAVNFVLPAMAQDWSAGEPKSAEAARGVLVDTPDKSGVALLIGVDAEFAWQLAKQSDLKVILLESDGAAVVRWRDELRQARVYGARVSVLHVEEYEKAPLPQCFANLVLLHGPRPGVSAATAQAWVKPGSGVLIATGKGTVPTVACRAPLKGIGEWTHMFGRADNSAFAGETLQGRASTADLEVQWFGLPGPRFNVDRNPRKPGPLAINGRLFVQGFGRIAAMDAYNGTILWTAEVPRLQRYNILHDGSNWCADADTIYAVYDEQVLILDAKSGLAKSRTMAIRDVLPKEHQGSHEWGYLASVGGQLLGSTVAKESAYKQFWGEVHWYDAKAGPNNHIICADRFFAVDPKTGKPDWVYTGGAILHPSICVADGKAYFVESRNSDLKKKSGRLGNEIFKDMRLVALDLKTGKEDWSQAIHPLPGKAAFSMATSGGKIVIVSSDAGKFGVYAYDAKNGASLWDKALKWEDDHHGKHLSRPAIVGEKLIVRPYVMKLNTGDTLSQAFPKGHTCASYCVTDKTLIFRAGELTMWQFDGKEESRWPRLRSDCLLSTIAAQGMVLSPEGGGGCSCGIWLEISVGFLPKSIK